MTSYDMQWVASPTVKNEHRELSCTQVYVWLVTSDEHVIIVSKNGESWQLPGGKPEEGENSVQTAVRETMEETGLDISHNSDSLQFFGYYVVTEVGSENAPYTQLRYMLRLSQNFDELSLGTGNEDLRQSKEDVIQFVEGIKLQDLPAKISWMAASPEYALVQSLLNN